MLNDIRAEHDRVGATEVRTTLTSECEPEAGELVKVEFDEAYWHLAPMEFLQLLKDRPAGAGADEIKRISESEAVKVWHGPAPPDARDRSDA